eukprot:TRINITY_DN12510_c1_g2_i2.p1 TRINITY_DN12510_c1_g2~~TRINITY_DN12510_c1_g2_i2.p1  ORF type:complete len:250 (+),score=61.38 TRINITY_DN12510_c1_g2_i2:117-866(+)
MAVEDNETNNEETKQKSMDVDEKDEDSGTVDKQEEASKMEQEGDDDEDRDHRRRGEDADDAPKTDASSGLDREKTCPLLLRMFCREGGHHRMEDYRGQRTPAEELQVYTWMDATLKEITTLVKEVNVSARRKGAKISIATVYKDGRGIPNLRILGDLTNGEESDISERTLQDLNFRIGDCMDIAIYNRRRESIGDADRPRGRLSLDRDDRVRRDGPPRRDNDDRRDRDRRGADRRDSRGRDDDRRRRYD